jgi:hypothetical protein
MTYRQLLAILAAIPEERKDSEALVFIPNKTADSGALYSLAAEVSAIDQVALDDTGFDDEHPVLLVEY